VTKVRLVVVRAGSVRLGRTRRFLRAEDIVEGLFVWDLLSFGAVTWTLEVRWGDEGGGDFQSDCK
jgi:hypothetical protein